MKIEIKETTEGQKYFDLSISAFIKEIMSSLYFMNALKSVFYDIDELNEMLTDLSLKNSISIDENKELCIYNTDKLSNLEIHINYLMNENKKKSILLLAVESIILATMLSFSFYYIIYILLKV